MPLSKPELPKLERCGFCGRWFIGDKIIIEEDLITFTNEQLKEAPLGYCPDAQAEYYQQNPEEAYPDRYNSDDLPF